MSARTYDPFAVERPVLRLGSHGAWTLGDITRSRAAKLNELIEEITALQEDESAGFDEQLRIVGRLCETACMGATGLADLVVDLADEDKHGDDAIGVAALNGVVEFIAEWFSSENTAGEG